MGSAIALRGDYAASPLRRLARRCGNVRQASRMLAIASVYDGLSRAEAARIGGMDRQTLRDWVHRFNEAGPDGLKDRLAPRRKRKLTSTQLKELAEIVEAGPDLARDGVTRWRRVDLRRLIEERYDVVYHERTVSKLLRALGFSKLSPRPQHPEQDARVIETFKKTSL